ncbi:MAG TPA: Fe-S cluster assembly protein SufD [Thermoanaerobaculia bacterium]|nr:Fe-S cluster assembly protein SufD [Thermoanaerobaculia bacterium]
MTTTATLEEGASAATAYAEDFEHFTAEHRGEPAFLSSLRHAAFDRFVALGFPTTDQEDWRFTNVAPIARGRFHRAAGLPKVSAEAVRQHFHPDSHRLVFLDGVFAPEFSELSALPSGVRVQSFGEVLRTEPGRLEGVFARHARFEEHPFVALSTAFASDGAVVEMARGALLEKPLQLLYLGTASETVRVSYPRNLVRAGEASQLTLIETYASLAERASWSAPVTEIWTGSGAVVDHYKLQKESTAAFHTATLQFYQERSSNLFSHSISVGGALVRNDVNAVLDGEGAECTLNGLYVLRGSQFLDNHMRVDHSKPHCSSFELFKGILDEKARAVFNGRIFVAKGAQKTDAKQSSRNLLLSRQALVNANPQLEIFADDVKCTHGSTVGQLDEEAIFYLRSRGIGEDAARSLLIYAFAADIVERLKPEALRHEVEEFLFHRLPKGEVVRQAV